MRNPGTCPPSEWTIDRLRKFHYVYGGSVKEVRKGMDRLVEAGNPEYFAWLSDQGMLAARRREAAATDVRRGGPPALQVVSAP